MMDIEFSFVPSKLCESAHFLLTQLRIEWPECMAHPLSTTTQPDIDSSKRGEKLEQVASVGRCCICLT
jgi:hypothetical protein